MSKLVRFALVIAFLIFIAGIVWAILTARGNRKESTTKTANTPTLIGTPSSTTTPSAPAPTVAPATPIKKPLKPAVNKPHLTRERTVLLEERVVEEVSASAWASASANADASSWAEAHTE